MGKILIKTGVEFKVIAPAGARILEVLKQLKGTFSHDVTITSGTDGEHSGPEDPHHKGEAYDFRSQGLTSMQKDNFLHTMQAALGSRFYMFLESPGTANEHFHAQRRKNTNYSIEDYLINA